MKIDNTQTVWFKKYQPQQVQDLVLPEKLKTKLQTMVDTEDIPHLGLFSSIPGTGKSSTANAIITEMGCEALWINASIDKGIDVLRGKISKFASQVSFDDKLKIVVMDEFDAFSHDGQRAFRGFIDEFSDNCRFIFTGNFKEKIIQPLMDRMEIYDFNEFSKTEMVKPVFERLRLILDEEGVQYDPKALVPVINTYYPSIRSMVGALQRYTENNKFEVSADQLDHLDVFDKILTYVLKRDFEAVIEEVNSVNAPDNMYTYLYKNMDKFKTEKRPQVVLIIAKYQHWASSVRDKNLNLGACLTEIMGSI